LKKVQKTATKLIHGLNRINYVERLKLLKLPTLKYRQIRGDMIQVFKVVHGIYNSSFIINLSFSKSLPLSLTTRGNSFTLLQHYCHYDLRRHNSTNRIVSFWNSLLNNVVTANTINTFKN